MIPEIEERIKQESQADDNTNMFLRFIDSVKDFVVNDFQRSRKEWGEYYKAVNEAEALQKNGHADQEV